MTKLKVLFACLGFVFLSPQSQAGLFDGLKGGGGGGTFDAVGQMIGSLASGAKTQICKQGGVCRKFNGFACGYSKNLVSTCAIICKDEPGFKESKCSQAAANAFSYDPYGMSYRTNNGPETAARHLARQLEKGKAGNNPAAQKFFDAFCAAKAVTLVHPDFKNEIKQACTVYMAKDRMQGGAHHDGMSGPMFDPMSETMENYPAAQHPQAPVHAQRQSMMEPRQKVQPRQYAPQQRVHDDSTSDSMENYPAAQHPQAQVGAQAYRQYQDSQQGEVQDKDGY